MSVASPNTQAIRSVNINSSASTPPHPNEVVYVDVYTDPITKDKFILWEDIRVAFHNALHIRHKARVLPFMKDADFNTLRPFRIVVILGEVLDIIVGNLPNTIPQREQSSVLRQIEEQAARLPKHNPLSTMRTITSTHPSSSLQTSRFAPAGNIFPRTVNNSRQQLDESALQARNMELAKKYARDAMIKVAAKLDLNALYTKGDAPPGDFWKALECYLKAVHQSHAHAQVSVGDLFSEGQGVTKDSSVAMGWYLKAASQGDANAQRKVETLTLSQLRQKVVPKAPAKNRPKDQGSARSPRGLQPPSANNKPQMSKDPVPPAPKSSDQMFLNADFGDKGAQVTLGDMYKEGKGVLQNYEQAMLWYLKAANQGSAPAQYAIGSLHNHGQGVPQDYERAMVWYLKAANQGSALAQYAIGSLYDYGQGVPQDEAQAMVWFLKAAKKGLPISQGIIGDFYSDGRGVSQNYTKAAECLGVCYHHGHGVPQSYIKAAEWYRKAEYQGHH
ncbi:hypothetical protein BGZ90_004627 [Linnemannia elongata]|nr:hypothetical protein BGZ90_004627 [Linnemannia elongata]